MEQKALEERRAYYRTYMKKWKSNNKEKVAKYNAEYWKKRADRNLKVTDGTNDER